VTVQLLGLMTAKNDEWIIERSAGRLAACCDAVVVVDDGSTDRTVEILRSMPGVSVICNPPGGKWDSALNARLLMLEAERLQPEWIMYIDSDDVVDARFAAERSALLAEPGVGRYFFREITLWGGIDRYRVDKPEWYGRNHGRTPHLVRYSPEVRFSDLYVRRRQRLMRTLWRQHWLWGQVRWRMRKPTGPARNKVEHVLRSLVWPPDMMDYTNFDFRGWKGRAVELDLVRLHYHFANLDYAWKKHMTYALNAAILQRRAPGEIPDLVAMASKKLDAEGMELAPVDRSWGAL
jgi:glycosyltransferase involved in cell wall biosynthesis